MEYCVLSLGWGVFFFLHSSLASERCKDWFHYKMGDSFRYYRLIYSVMAFITLSGVLALQFSIPFHSVGLLPFLRYFIALPLVICALVLMAVCIAKYFFKLSGVEVLYQQQVHPFLETQGLHKFVRHPLYLGSLLLIWSLLLLFPSGANLLACIMITVYVRIGIHSEEGKLQRVFGTQYQNYKKKTPMLIPLSKRRSASRR